MDAIDGMEVVGPFPLWDVSRVPDLPGVYAWYAQLIIGTADRRTPQELLSAINRFSSRLRPSRMQVKARLNFNLAWNGDLEDERWRTPSTEFLGACPSGDTLALVNDLLAAAQHTLAQPLYIGKAPNGLRSRLNQHAREFIRLRGLKRDPGDETLGEETFAQRAFKLGFLEDHLVCYVLPVRAAKSIPKRELDAAISLVESLLNSWATPLLGRK